MGKGGGTVLFPHLVNIAKMGYGLNRNPLFLMVGIGKAGKDWSVATADTSPSMFDSAQSLYKAKKQPKI